MELVSKCIQYLIDQLWIVIKTSVKYDISVCTSIDVKICIILYNTIYQGKGSRCYIPGIKYYINEDFYEYTLTNHVIKRSKKL